MILEREVAEQLELSEFQREELGLMMQSLDDAMADYDPYEEVFGG